MLEVKFQEQGLDKKTQSEMLDQDIDQFSVYMLNLGDWKAAGPLLPQEKFLLKTYLIYKLKQATEQGSP